MKTNSWLAGCGLALGVFVAANAPAQVNTNSLPNIPAATATVPVPSPEAVAAAAPDATTNAPAKKASSKTHKKHILKKAKATKTTKAKAKVAKVTKAEKAEVVDTNAAPLAVTLVPGEAVVNVDHVNVRGQAGLRGEVVTHLQKGDKVNVIAEINLDKHKADEPAQWAKISLPAETKVWVDSQFVDATNKTVTAKKLNLRGGPSENYSVLGVVDAGTVVTPVGNKGNWLQIATPTNAFAFVAASFLTQSNATVDTTVAAATVPAPEPTPAPAVTPTPEPAPAPVVTTTNTVTETPAIVAAPPVDTNAATATVTAPSTNAPAATNNISAVLASEAAAAAAAAATNSAEMDTNPPPPRIVTHEGVVHSVTSIIAPTYFELDDATSGKAINYLFTTSTNLDLSKYNKLHIIVTGEETLVQRWKNTPMLTIQRIQVVE